jgi:RNAse (barnase) inhibitor barstar
MERDYNSTRPKMAIKEYGRNVQNLVDYALTIEDRNKRTKLAYIIISVMQQVNPIDSPNEEYYKKLWNHLYAISNYELDIDYPYDVVKKDVSLRPTEHISYKENRIKYRFYGQNTELVLQSLAEKEEGEERDQLLIIMANQMKEMYISWNKNIVSDELINEHIMKITDGKLKLPEGVKLVSSNTILKKIHSVLSVLKSAKDKKNNAKRKPKQKAKSNYKKRR